MHPNARIIILLAVAIIHLDLSTALLCVQRDFGRGSPACECNRTYCDEIEIPERPDDGVFLFYTSSKYGYRLDPKEGKFAPPTEEGPFDSAECRDGQELTFLIDHNKTYQTLLGFGGAFTDAAGRHLYDDADIGESILQAYFGDNGLRYTFGRVPMAGSDFSERPYTYDDLRSGDIISDDTLSFFSLTDEDYNFKIPHIKRAMELSNDTLKLFATPWSAPPWMKSNKDIRGRGWLLSKYYQTWANYFIRFLEEYKKHGINFWGLTTQNEPASGLIPFYGFNCMGWTPTWQKKWIKTYLGPTLQDSEFKDVKLIMLDDNRILLPYWTHNILKDKGAAQYISGIGLHWYFDRITSPHVLTTTHEKYPDKFILGTEAAAGAMPPNKGVVLGSWERGESYAKDIFEDLENWAVGWVDSNLVLDTDGGPNWAFNYADAPIIVDESQEGVFYKQPTYYNLAHFSAFLPPGSVRVGVAGTKDCFHKPSVIVFQRPDGAFAVVLINRRDDRVKVALNDPIRGTARIELPERSIQTLLYW